MLCCACILQRVLNLFLTYARCLVCHNYVAYLVYCIGKRLDFISLVYECFPISTLLHWSYNENQIL